MKKGCVSKFSVWIKTNVLTESDHDDSAIECTFCDARVGTALVWFTMRECCTKLVFRCKTCTPHDDNYLRLRHETDLVRFKNFFKTKAGKSIEGHARLFEQFNQHPRRLVHEVIPRAERRCACCSKVGAGSFCGSCERVAYCDKKCQTRDWKRRHKAQCCGKRNIFHIRGALMINCDYIAYRSNFFIACGCNEQTCGRRCKQCGHSQAKQRGELRFFQGFCARSMICAKCLAPQEEDFGVELLEDIAFAATAEDFHKNATAIKTTKGTPAWLKVDEKVKV